MAGWRRDMEINVLGVALGIKRRAAHATGSIINTASLFGLMAVPTCRLQRIEGGRDSSPEPAVELGPKSIRVNAICPTD